MDSFCELVSGLREGELLDDKYRIEGVLGVGGMGAVLAATHVELERQVALKVLRPELVREGRIVKRLVAEGRAAARIQSEHVAKVIDVGRLPSGSPYVVMERLEGAAFDQILEQRGALPLVEVADALVQTCEALAEAHAAGIVHRDLKPANLFLASRPDGTRVVKLLDFGISKAGSERRRRSGVMTDPHLALGSPNYMAPEQVKAANDVDPRADIWALGTLLFELLTTRRAFDADELTALQASILFEEPPSLRAHRPDLPAAIDRIMRRCLMKDRRARYSDVEELARALVRFGSEGARASHQRIVRVLEKPQQRSRASLPVAALGKLVGAGVVLAAAAFVAIFLALGFGAKGAAARLESVAPELRATLPSVETPAAEPVLAREPPPEPQPAVVRDAPVQRSRAFVLTPSPL